MLTGWCHTFSPARKYAKSRRGPPVRSSDSPNGQRGKRIGFEGNKRFLRFPLCNSLGNGLQKDSIYPFPRLPHRRSTRHIVSFSASRKFCLCLDFSSSPQKPFAFAGTPICATPRNDIFKRSFRGSEATVGIPILRGRLPRQFANWLAMTGNV